MTAQELAGILLPLLPRVQIPMTADNAQATAAIYHTLGQMSRGELILITPAPPPKD